MALNRTSTDEFSAEHGVKCLVHSPSGWGKTRLTATAPNPVIISAESGLLSLKKFRILAFIVKSLDDLNDVYRWVTESKEADQYWTVGLDTVSEIAEVVLSGELKKKSDPRAAYGEMQQKMQVIIRSFRDLTNKHVYFAAKSSYEKDETGLTKWLPDMPGKNATNGLPYYFDEVFALRLANEKDPSTGEPWRYLQTKPDLQYVAKDRSGSLANIEPPDLTHIFNKIMAG